MRYLPLRAVESGCFGCLDGQAGKKNERNIDYQFWMQHNHPIELLTREMTLQRLNYMHLNPVEIGFVEKAEEWLHSSCGDYFGNRKGLIDLIFIE